MNKIASIKSHVRLWEIEELSNMDTSRKINKIMLNVFGMECVGHNSYNFIIRDESKFILFMLKYPEQIERIFQN